MSFTSVKLKSPRTLLRLFGGVLLASVLFSGPVQAGTNAYWSWFKHKDDLKGYWKIEEDHSDSLKLKIRRLQPGTEAKKKIFVLFPRRSSAYDIAMDKILRIFQQKDINAEFTIVNFNREHDLANAAIKQAERGKYDLIFSMGSQSTAWLYANYRNGSIPVVSVCSKDPVVLKQTASYNTGSGTNFAFTSLNMPVDVQMAYVKKLKPKLKNIAILVNSKNVSAVQTQAEPMMRYARLRGIRALNLAIKDPQNAKEELAQLVSAAVVKMRKNDPTLDNSVFWITGSTAVFREIAVINRHADRVPVLSVVPEVVSSGDDSAVMSVGISFESNAHLAAIYGASILAGTAKVGELKVGVVTPPDIAINFRKARDIGLKVPFSFFSRASFVYDYDGRLVRDKGKAVAAR